MTETEARLNSHEAVCLLRYESINARLKRIERILITSAFGLITTGFAMCGVLLTIVLKLN
jgi:hypothetical protein